MFPKFFSVIQGVKDDFFLSYHSLTISSTMALKHICVGYLFVEEDGKIL